jgi:hypothetical protein
MRIYKKLHENKEVADRHIAKIKERGGNGTVKKYKQNYITTYSFDNDNWINQTVFLFEKGGKSYDVRTFCVYEKWHL